MINVTLNGEKISTTENNIEQFLISKNIEFQEKWTVIVINENIIDKTNINKITINNNDIIEIVKPFSGG